jgi:hypothetical protein
MLHNKHKMICHTLIIALTIVILGFCSYSSVSAFPFQSAIHHHNKVFDKKQDSGSNSRDAHSDGSGGRPISSSDKTGDHLQISSSHSSDSGSSSSSSPETKSSDNTDNVYSANTNKNNNDQSINDGSNTDADNNLHSVEPAKTGEQQQQGAGENPPLIGTATPTPQASCEQGSICTDQQNSSNNNHSTTDTTSTTTTKEDNMPFVLPMPFP